MSKSELISVKEKLPKNGQKIYLFLLPPDEEKPYKIFWKWDKQDGMDLKINGHDITHWSLN